MLVTKTYKRKESQEFLNSIINHPKVLKTFQEDKDFLEAKVTKDVRYVINNIKMIFDIVKQVSIEEFESRGFKAPSTYFLITPFHLSTDVKEEEIYSMTLSFRSRIGQKNINIKKLVAFNELFRDTFKQTIKDLFEVVISYVVCQYNIKVLNSALLAGAHFYYDMGYDFDDMDIDSFINSYVDYENARKEADGELILPRFDESDLPIVDISRDKITFGVDETTIVKNIDNMKLNKLADFIYDLVESRVKIKDLNSGIEELNSKLIELKVKESEKNEDNSSVSDEEDEEERNLAESFYGLEDFFDDSDNEKEEEDNNEIELIEKEIDKKRKEIGLIGFKLNMDMIEIRPIVNDLYNKLISSDTTISLLGYYPEAIMELVVGRPTHIRTQRIAPILKGSFFSDEEAFADVDNGLLFTYVNGYKERTPLGPKLVPDNAFHGKIIKKVDGVEQSVGLDDFFMSKLSKLAKFKN